MELFIVLMIAGAAVLYTLYLIWPDLFRFI